MDRNMKIGMTMIILGLVLSLGLGYYFGTITASPQIRPNLTQPSSSPLVLSIVETMNNKLNSTAPAQPKFLVATKNGLESAANITIPSGTLIELVITSYDTGSTPPPPQYDAVTGTVNNEITVINGTIASGTNITQQYQLKYTSVPGTMIIHTFTVPQLNLNIPIIGGTTEIAYFRANTKGTFQWLCLTPCGTGSDGLGGAMKTAGWMIGQITVT
jgi:heme/copper-type cytochrome/quinol oxidase subunit 2